MPAPTTTNSHNPILESNPNLSLQAVGGLKNVLQELHELVTIPLKRPDLLTQLGLEPTRGILLVGPPGTGKTLTVRALAAELGIAYIAIAGPEIVGKYYGEAELRLRQVFKKATATAPCIVFIDEIDSIAPNRNKVEGEVEKRVVAQLLSLMDGFSQLKGVIVLGATNRPHHLDPALRRPGRFDREIYFRVPDAKGRLEILRIHTGSMPLDGTVNLRAIADLTVGFVGADLKALCQKAAYQALRRVAPSIHSIARNISINHQDFLAALRDIKPSVLRPVAIETPNVTWEQIGGLAAIKQTLQESVEGALLYPQLYKQMKAIAPKGILLWGPPGTGKTMLAKAVASQARANFIAVKGSELHSRWVGESEQAVRDLFARARQASPCVVFIDEVDTLIPSRKDTNADSGVSARVVGQLLTEIDGIESGGDSVIIVAATNRPDLIDPALLRAGRLDLHVKVDLPDLTSRMEILVVHCRDRPLAEDVNLAAWAVRTEGWNGAELALLSDRATLEGIRRYLSLGLINPPSPQVIPADFEMAYQYLLERRFVYQS